jgi:hypothetical protein
MPACAGMTEFAHSRHGKISVITEEEINER